MFGPQINMFNSTRIPTFANEQLGFLQQETSEGLVVTAPPITLEEKQVLNLILQNYIQGEVIVLNPTNHQYSLNFQSHPLSCIDINFRGEGAAAEILSLLRSLPISNSLTLALVMNRVAVIMYSSDSPKYVILYE